MENLIAQLEGIVKGYCVGGVTELNPYKVRVIQDAIPYLKKYAEVEAKVDEYKEKTKQDKPVENHLELMVRLKELEAHQLCLANQILEIFEEET